MNKTNANTTPKRNATEKINIASCQYIPADLTPEEKHLLARYRTLDANSLYYLNSMLDLEVKLSAKNRVRPSLQLVQGGRDA